MEPGLYIVGTPIGNLEDITLRALRVLKESDYILCEDTRHSRKLLSHYDIKTPCHSYHKFNEAKQSESWIKILQEGHTVSLISDAGMPGISDPGARIVQACHEKKIPLFSVPGPSALSAAISLCGWEGSKMEFIGFLPPKSAARKRFFTSIQEKEIPVVLFESPHRIRKLLEEAALLLPDRTFFLARELTKKFEECTKGTPQQILTHYGTRTIKGEMVVIIGPT